MQEMCKFKINKFNHEGIRITDRKFFPELVIEWETDFYKKFSPHFANHLLSNQTTMTLIGKCLDLGNNEKCGAELINGEVDINTHMKMEAYSRYHTIYAVGSEIPGNEEEPIFLIIDDKLADGIVWLKYIDDTEGEAEEIPDPVDVCKQVKG